MNNKIKLGTFVTLGLFAIVISMIMIGNFSFGKKYKIYVLFDNASGLTKKAKVKLAGVDIGDMRGVSLYENKARLCLVINAKVPLYQNATANIVSMGIVGTKYIEIHPGDSSFPILKDGDTILKSERGSLEQTIEKIADKISSVVDSMSKDGKNGDMIDNLADSICDLKSIISSISSQNAKIVSSIENINKFSYNLAEITEQNKNDIRDTFAAIKDIINKIDMITSKIYDGNGPLATIIGDEDMSKDLKDTITNAKETLASAKSLAEGLNKTIGKSSKLKLSWNYAGRYNLKDEKMRNDLGITIMPNDDKFYYVGIANVSDSSDVKDREERNTINTLEALMGFRFNKFEIYGGILRGKAGGGIGYSFFEPVYAPYKKMQFHLNAYNFGRSDKRPEIDAGLRFGFTKWLYAGVMVEDALYKTAVTPYIKIEIDDPDIAAILGIASIAAVATR
ncbi:MAG: MlaD family protein [Endomicrobium sp.]|jgi:phospholipid/cholesterol/gamma-HCH transport system substrate-binding protein|nr:MlaD family protein [Endomicrobium sp.]